MACVAGGLAYWGLSYLGVPIKLGILMSRILQGQNLLIPSIITMWEALLKKEGLEECLAKMQYMAVNRGRI